MRKRTSTSKTPDTQPAAMHEPDADVSSEGRRKPTSSCYGGPNGRHTGEQCVMGHCVRNGHQQRRHGFHWG